jgi:predicted helicase
LPQVSQRRQFFPRWAYEKLESSEGELDLVVDAAEVDSYGYRRIDNITDDILTLYQGVAGDGVTKDDIFYYAYGIMHEPSYCTRYAADLNKMLPHIPTPESADRFTDVVDIGRKLADVHLNYETVKPYPLDVEVKNGVNPNDREAWRVDKMRWRSKTDRDAIVYNSKVIVTGIPAKAHDYVLGSPTALEWIIDRYQVKTDKASGIINDPNDWCDEHDDPTNIVDLIKKITTVSVETVALVEQLSR